MANSESMNKDERQECLELVVKSDARKKLIVAGPGTGKTFTFGQVLEQEAENGPNLVMTFIRRLVEDLDKTLAPYAQVKTFHAFCKRILHELIGHFELLPDLPSIIERDAAILGKKYGGFIDKIQRLEEDSEEVQFYLRRGNYYQAVSFDDTVYRVFRASKEDPKILPEFNQIVIDEYQDFNPLEVAFIEQLEEKGKILIVGDDDQAVYDRRNASAHFLREKYEDKEFEKFELPFCSRCPESIIKATHHIVEQATNNGYLESRIPKRFEYYDKGNQEVAEGTAALVFATLPVIKTIPYYIATELAKLDPEDVRESHARNEPTALIIGQKHFLQPLRDRLDEAYQLVGDTPPSTNESMLTDGYRLVHGNRNSNIGWRILAESFLSPAEFEKVLIDSESGEQMTKFLDADFVARHLDIADRLDRLSSKTDISADDMQLVKDTIGGKAQSVLDCFQPLEAQDEPPIDIERPSVMLRSFVGAKGLEAQFVFILGANNGDIPKDPEHIHDTEISQFLVALTRTRTQCHIIHTRQNFFKRGATPNQVSEIVNWIPNDLMEDRGFLMKKDLS